MWGGIHTSLKLLCVEFPLLLLVLPLQFLFSPPHFPQICTPVLIFHIRAGVLIREEGSSFAPVDLPVVQVGVGVCQVWILQSTSFVRRKGFSSCSFCHSPFCVVFFFPPLFSPISPSGLFCLHSQILCPHRSMNGASNNEYWVLFIDHYCIFLIVLKIPAQLCWYNDGTWINCSAWAPCRCTIFPACSSSCVWLFCVFLFHYFLGGVGGALKMGGGCLVVISMDSLDSHM